MLVVNKFLYLFLFHFFRNGFRNIAVVLVHCFWGQLSGRYPFGMPECCTLGLHVFENRSGKVPSTRSQPGSTGGSPQKLEARVARPRSEARGPRPRPSFLSSVPPPAAFLPLRPPSRRNRKKPFGNTLPPTQRHSCRTSRRLGIGLFAGDSVQHVATDEADLQKNAPRRRTGPPGNPSPEEKLDCPMRGMDWREPRIPRQIGHDDQNDPPLRTSLARPAGPRRRPTRPCGSAAPHWGPLRQRPDRRHDRRRGHRRRNSSICTSSTSSSRSCVPATSWFSTTSAPTNSNRSLTPSKPSGPGSSSGPPLLAKPQPNRENVEQGQSHPAETGRQNFQCLGRRHPNRLGEHHGGGCRRLTGLMRLHYFQTALLCFLIRFFQKMFLAT